MPGDKVTVWPLRNSSPPTNSGKSAGWAVPPLSLMTCLNKVTEATPGGGGGGDGTGVGGGGGGGGTGVGGGGGVIGVGAPPSKIPPPPNSSPPVLFPPRPP